jgi:hypothetical protein
LIDISYLFDIQNQRYATNHLIEKMGMMTGGPITLSLLYVIRYLHLHSGWVTIDIFSFCGISINKNQKYQASNIWVCVILYTPVIKRFFPGQAPSMIRMESGKTMARARARDNCEGGWARGWQGAR